MSSDSHAIARRYSARWRRRTSGGGGAAASRKQTADRGDGERDEGDIELAFAVLYSVAEAHRLGHISAADKARGMNPTRARRIAPHHGCRRSDLMICVFVCCARACQAWMKRVLVETGARAVRAQLGRHVLRHHRLLAPWAAGAYKGIAYAAGPSTLLVF